MKKALSFLLGFVMLFALIGCGVDSSTPSGGDDDNVGGGSLIKLETPVLSSVDLDTGIVSWEDVEHASGYAYRIDGGNDQAHDGAKDENENNVYALEFGKSLQVKAVGDGKKYGDGDWSQAVTFGSYLLNNVGERAGGINIYTADGESVLETFYGLKFPGDILETGKDYIFEFDGSMGTYKSGLMFTGVENAVISDIVWSDSSYDDRDGEETVADILKEVKYCDIATWGSFHRSDWYDNDPWGRSSYAWQYGSDAKNTEGVYDTSEDDFWTEPVNECAQFYNTHWLASAKSTTQMRAELKLGLLDDIFLRLKINFKSFDVIAGPNYNTAVYNGKSIDSIAGRTNFNFFAFFNSAHYYAFLDGKHRSAPIKGATQSYAVDQNGENTSGVNIYDKTTGELVLASMDTAGVGNVLESDKDYVFEFKVETTVDSPLLMTGLVGAKITDALWTDTLYSADTQDSSPVSDTVYMATRASSSAKNQPLFHFLTWNSQENRYSCLKGASVMGKPYEYQWSTDYTCTSFSNMYFYVTGQRTDTANKTYFRITVRFVANEEVTFCKTGFIHIGAGSIVTDKESAKYGQFNATDFNMWLFYGEDSYTLYLADAVTPFEPAPDPEPDEEETAA